MSLFLFGNYKDTPRMGPFFSYSDHPHFKRGNKKLIISPAGLSTVTNYDFSDRQYLSNRKKRVHFQARMDLNKTVMPSRPAALILQTILLILMSCPQPECVARILKAMHPKYWKSSFRSPDIEPAQWSDEMHQDFFAPMRTRNLNFSVFLSLFQWLFTANNSGKMNL